MRKIRISAALCGLTAVILGAFGAHILKKMLSPDLLEAFKTGVQYQFYHTFAILFICLIGTKQQIKLLKNAAYFFLLGIFLFSGSLYVMAITGIKILGIITPFGGLAFIIGWLCLALVFLRWEDAKDLN